MTSTTANFANSAISTNATANNTRLRAILFSPLSSTAKLMVVFVGMNQASCYRSSVIFEGHCCSLLGRDANGSRTRCAPDRPQAGE